MNKDNIIAKLKYTNNALEAEKEMLENESIHLKERLQFVSWCLTGTSLLLIFTIILWAVLYG